MSVSFDHFTDIKKTGVKLDVASDESVRKTLELIELNFSSGEKSIAFGSTHYKNSQEKCILLAGDFFNKKFSSLRILIITFDLKSGVFAPFIAQTVKKKEFYQLQPNTFLMDWEELLKAGISPQRYVDDFDMVFWDLPSLDVISKRQAELRTSFTAMDSLYIISLKNNKFDERAFMVSIMNYYQDHGLDIRTILPWKIGEKNRKPRSKISLIFYGLFRR